MPPQPPAETQAAPEEAEAVSAVPQSGMEAVLRQKVVELQALIVLLNAPYVRWDPGDGDDAHRDHASAAAMPPIPEGGPRLLLGSEVVSQENLLKARGGNLAGRLNARGYELVQSKAGEALGEIGNACGQSIKSSRADSPIGGNDDAADSAAGIFAPRCYLAGNIKKSVVPFYIHGISLPLHAWH
jgi:hypothetical protein